MEISRLLRASGPRYGAVAYVGSAGAELLPFGRGDVLVVNAGDHTLQSGGTSPAALRKLRKRGVELWSDSQLHAKVATTARGYAVIGSANASGNSSLLNEAVLAENDATVRREVRAFVKSLLGHCVKVDERFLRRAEGLYAPPQGRVGDDSPPPPLFTVLPKRLVIAPCEPYEPTKKARKIADVEIAQLPRVADIQYEMFGWWDDPIDPYDALISSERGWLSPPARVQSLSNGVTVNNVIGRDPFLVTAAVSSQKSKRLRVLDEGTQRAIDESLADDGLVALITDKKLIRRVMRLWYPDL